MQFYHVTMYLTFSGEKQDLKAAALIPAEAAVKSYAAPFIDWSLESNCITLIRLAQMSSTI